VELERIINRALEKDRNLRYQHASDMRTELERLKRDTESAHVSAAGSGSVHVFQESEAHASKRNLWKVAAPSILVVAALLAGGLYYRSHRTKPLTDKDTVVLADFDNKTGDPVFDDSLKQALAIELGQSPFLNIISDQKIGETLQMMSRPKDQRITIEIGREVCIRTGSKALLSGTISSLGSHYLVELNAVACSTGDTLAREQGEASVKEDVLKTLGRACSYVRNTLGESLASVEKFDVPMAAKTSSLEALKSWSIGIRTFHEKGDEAAVPFLKRAIELDPNFARAYSSLAVSYSNLGQPSLAREYATKAYGLRNRVTERDKFYITGEYFEKLDDLEKAMQAYELFTANYPDDMSAHGNLGYAYQTLSQYDKALSENQEALRIAPDDVINYSNLAFTYVCPNRLDEAKSMLDEALARKLDDSTLHIFLYVIAFLRDDAPAMAQQVAWYVGLPDVLNYSLEYQSETETYYGRLSKHGAWLVAPLNQRSVSKTRTSLVIGKSGLRCKRQNSKTFPLRDGPSRRHWRSPQLGLSRLGGHTRWLRPATFRALKLSPRNWERSIRSQPC
jgi:eukaryotic-like serine/threonine-protein kinase